MTLDHPPIALQAPDSTPRTSEGKRSPGVAKWTVLNPGISGFTSVCGQFEQCPFDIIMSFRKTVGRRFTGIGYLTDRRLSFRLDTPLSAVVIDRYLQFPYEKKKRKGSRICQILQLFMRAKSLIRVAILRSKPRFSWQTVRWDERSFPVAPQLVSTKRWNCATKIRTVFSAKALRRRSGMLTRRLPRLWPTGMPSTSAGLMPR